MKDRPQPLKWVNYRLKPLVEKKGPKQRKFFKRIVLGAVCGIALFVWLYIVAEIP